MTSRLLVGSAAVVRGASLVGWTACSPQAQGLLPQAQGLLTPRRDPHDPDLALARP